MMYVAFSAGTLPTTVLGQVQSPDIDDWSEKVYKFEDRPPRYIFFLSLVLATDTQSDESKARARQCGGYHFLLYWMLLIVNHNEIPHFF